MQDSTGTLEIKLPDNGNEAAAEPHVGDAIEVWGVSQGGRKITARDWTIFGSTQDDAHEGSLSTCSYLRFRDPDRVSVFRRMNQAEQSARSFLLDQHFVEVRVPLLWRSVQEYAEPEFRVSHPLMGNRGYSLLQSPMPPSLLACIGGLDRVFQFGRCIRWEGATADPMKATEFTHLNLTMTFMRRDEAKKLVELLMSSILRGIGDEAPPVPFPSISYSDSIRKYGTDAPDFRYQSILTPSIPPQVFGSAAGLQGVFIPRRLPWGVLEPLGSLIHKHLGPEYGIATTTGDEVTSRGPIAVDQRAVAFANSLGVESPLTLIVLPDLGAQTRIVVELLRTNLQGAFGSAKGPSFAFVWVDSPPFITDVDVQTLFGGASAHRSRSLFGHRPTDQAGEHAQDQYVAGFDLVLNGVEIMSGGEKEHRAEQFQENVRLAGVQRANTRYDYFVDALRKGAPPLCTAALGWERFLWKALGLPSIQDAIFLPKTNLGECPVAGVPESMDV